MAKKKETGKGRNGERASANGARTASLERKTKETDIVVALNLDGTGQSKVTSGVGFFDHMLSALSKHSAIDLNITCKGDTHIDDHHTVEDTGIVIGTAVVLV